MKKITVRGLIVVAAIVFQSNFIFAQWIPTPPSRLVTDDRIGIGPVPVSALDINSNLMSAFPNPGEVFRTNSNATGSNFNAWRMFTGAGNGTEKFALLNPAGTNNIFLRASVNGANMQFQINGPGILGGSTPITRMVITDGAFLGNTGLIGMGNGFLTPQSQLHLNDGVFSTYLQITNFATNASALNPAATDGFKLGIASDGTAEIRQQENLAMNFFTNDILRIHINENKILGPTNSINGF